MAYITAYPTVVATERVSPESNNGWDNPDNVKADDAAYASITASTFDSPDISYRLKCQGFDFSAVPDGVEIHGIMVEIERYNDAGETGKDYRVQLLDASGTLVGDNKAVGDNWPTTPTRIQYGGATDKWNANPTPAMVKDADFGVVLSAQATSANADIYVDYIKITVWYGTIDIGPGAVNWTNYFTAQTLVDKANPANADGNIDTFEIWANSNMSNCEAATFYIVSGNNLSTRDYQAIGSVTAGSKQTFTSLTIDVLTNDYLGTYFSAGYIECDYNVAVGDWYKSGDNIPCTNTAFSWLAASAISIYGTGTEAAGGWANIAKVSGVAAAAIAKVNGVAVASIGKLSGVAV